MSLNGLPDELLVEVVKYLHPTPGPQFDKAHWGLLAESESHDICQLANTSRRFYNLCRARLYSTYIQNGNGSLALFLRTLLARPELGKHVEHVNLVPGRSDPEPISFKKNLSTDIELLALFEYMRPDEAANNVVPNETEFRGRVTSPPHSELPGLFEWSALVSLLLPRLPNLQDIHIPDLGRADPRYFTPIYSNLERAISLQRRSKWSEFSMQKLKSLTIGWDRGKRKDPKNDWGSIDIKQVLPFLALPSIETFHGIELRTDPVSPSSWMKWKDWELALGITDLKLDRCNLARETLFEFLQPFNCLETFRYEEGGDDVGDYDCDPRGFLPALSHLKSTLKKIVFINRHTLYDSQMERGTLGSFADFLKLETIDTMAFSLIPSNLDERELDETQRLRLVDILPHSLKHLTLREFETRNRTVLHVSKVIKLKNHYTPNLAKIVLERRGEEFADGEINWIWKGLKSIGVKPEMERARYGSVRLARVVMTC